MSEQTQYQLTIYKPTTGLIIEIETCNNDKKAVKQQLLAKGYEVCKRKEAEFCCCVQKVCTDFSEFHFWIRKVKVA